MDPHGVWRLAPAYDVTYARGAGFTRTHQMTLNNKSDGFTRDDLLSLGASMRIKRDGGEIIDRIVKVIGETGRVRSRRQGAGRRDRAHPITGPFGLTARCHRPCRCAAPARIADPIFGRYRHVRER